MKSLLLFDVDGTLLITRGATTRCITRACKSIFGESFEWGGVTVGTLDPQIFAQLTAHNGVADAARHHEGYRAAYLRELEAELQRVRDDVVVLPGIRELLDRLGVREDVVLGLLTGNYGGAVRLKLAAAGLDPEAFAVRAFAEDGRDRSELVRAALGQYERQVGRPADRGRVLVIGDTPRDVACAKDNGCVAFAVATGRYGEAELAAAGADRVVPNLADPSPLLEYLDR